MVKIFFYGKFYKFISSIFSRLSMNSNYEYTLFCILHLHDLAVYYTQGRD